MAKIIDLLIPPELKALFESVLNVNFLGTDGKVAIKKMTSPRRLNKENFMREAFKKFKAEKPFDNIAGQKDSYDYAAHPQGLTNMQGWVSQVGSAVNNNLDRTEEVLTGKRFGRFLKLVNPAGGAYGIMQEHPASCYTSRKILGKRGRREIIEISEPPFNTITISFSYKFAVATIFPNEFSPFFRFEFYSDAELSTLSEEYTRYFIQDNDWHDYTETFALTNGFAASYRMKISTQDITYLAIDSLNFYHDGINWARDRNCSDVLFDPPHYYTSDTPEILLNSNFTNGFTDWNTFSNIAPYNFFENGRVRVELSPPDGNKYYLTLYQIPLADPNSYLPEGSYTLKITCLIPSGIIGANAGPFSVDPPAPVIVYLLENGGFNHQGFGVYSNGGFMTTYTADVYIEPDTTYEMFTIQVRAEPYKGPIFIDSVSLKSRKQINAIHHWDYFEGLGVGGIEQGQIGDVGFD
jgi:hypothetical protein